MYQKANRLTLPRVNRFAFTRGRYSSIHLGEALQAGLQVGSVKSYGQIFFGLGRNRLQERLNCQTGIFICENMI